ncbi:MAG: 2-hydroxychromene-2-carboxylate isomerase [Geminicoccaceae bacterium]
MSRVLTVYYGLQSTWTYLGWARLRELVARTGADARYRPVQSGPLFQASGTLPLAQRPPQRQAYRLMELRRWRDHLELPLNLHPKHFPVDEAPAARMVIAHRQRGGDIAALSQAMLSAVWAEERNLADRDTLLEIAREQGADGPALLAAADDDDNVQSEYQANTHAAIEHGVFGVPAFVIGDELFWGQDRLDFVARALA